MEHPGQVGVEDGQVEGHQQDQREPVEQDEVGFPRELLHGDVAWMRGEYW